MSRAEDGLKKMVVELFSNNLFLINHKSIYVNKQFVVFSIPLTQSFTRSVVLSAISM